MDWRIQKVNRYLQEGIELEHRSAITELADSVNLSVSRLRHLFKAETGMGLKKCLIESRLENARELLEGSSLSVKEIAGRMGYANVSNFVRDFKRRHRRTPTDHRKQYLNGKYASERRLAGNGSR